MDKRSSVFRLLLAVLLGASSIAFVAITPTPPPLTASTPPPMTPTQPPIPEGQAPVIVVYPFDVQTGADPRIGMAIAQILAQEMNSAGGLAVLPIPQGVKRTDFLDSARNNRADFYISGYVVPVGDSARVVEQVVSVESGVILFSQTAQVTSVADVASQSLLARTQILEFVGRGTQSLEAQTSSTPAPTSTNGAQVPIRGISNIVNSVFSHKGGSHSTSSAVAVVKPERGIIVAPVTATGTVAPAELGNAANELFFALNRLYTAQMTSIATPVATSADTICGANRDNTIATGTLAEVPAGHNKFKVTFTLAVYTCFGAPLGSVVGKGATLKAAVDSAVVAYATAHPDNS